MTPPTGVMFLTAMRRSAPCLGEKRLRRTSILVSVDAGPARLVSRVPLGPRCRKSGSVPGWRAPDYRLTAVGLRPRGSGPLLKRVGRQALASSPASEASSPRSRALIRHSGRSSAPARSRLAVGGPAPSALGRSAAPASEASSQRSKALIPTENPERQLDSRSIATQRRECVSNKDWLLGFPRPRWPRPFAVCERPHRSAAQVRPTHSAIRDFSGRLSASARSRFARGKRAPSGFSRSMVKGPSRPLEA
jgi:hypothetical protein